MPAPDDRTLPLQVGRAEHDVQVGRICAGVPPRLFDRHEQVIRGTDRQRGDPCFLIVPAVVQQQCVASEGRAVDATRMQAARQRRAADGGVSIQFDETMVIDDVGGPRRHCVHGDELASAPADRSDGVCDECARCGQRTLGYTDGGRPTRHARDVSRHHAGMEHGGRMGEVVQTPLPTRGHGNGRRWLWRPIWFAVLGVVLATITIGIPTDVIANPWFTRMTPVRTQDVVFLALTALLTGLLCATYGLPRAASCSLQEGRTLAGGMLSFFAIGCPTCNKLVILLLGTSGALRWFEPVQPFLAVASLLLLAVAVWTRWRLLRPALALARGV